MKEVKRLYRSKENNIMAGIWAEKIYYVGVVIREKLINQGLFLFSRWQIR